MIASNGLVYTFIPTNVAEKLLYTTNNPAQLTEALEQTETILEKELENPNPEFRNYVSDFTTQICTFVDEPSFKICLTSLRIIHKLCLNVVELVQLSNKEYERLLEVIDQKVVIRHSVLKIFYLLARSQGGDLIVEKVF